MTYDTLTAPDLQILDVGGQDFERILADDNCFDLCIYSKSSLCKTALSCMSICFKFNEKYNKSKKYKKVFVGK